MTQLEQAINAAKEAGYTVETSEHRGAPGGYHIQRASITRAGVSVRVVRALTFDRLAVKIRDAVESFDGHPGIATRSVDVEDAKADGFHGPDAYPYALGMCRAALKAAVTAADSTWKRQHAIAQHAKALAEAVDTLLTYLGDWDDPDAEACQQARAALEAYRTA
ncbi:MAG: hypothetical protein IT464_12610 [Planctomycetes bacterium]|nr:hypothetical protein [Planctomycetota bacterium]